MTIKPTVDWAEGIVEAGYMSRHAYLSVDHKCRICVAEDDGDREVYLLSDSTNGPATCLMVAAILMRAVAWTREATPDGPRLGLLAAELEALARTEV